MDHNLYEMCVRVSQQLLTCVYSTNLGLRSETHQLATHLNISLWLPGIRPLSPSLNNITTYTFTFYHAAIICIYVENLPCLPPIYNLEHHQKQKAFADVERLWCLWIWTLPNIPFFFFFFFPSSHFTDFKQLELFLEQRLYPLFPKPYIPDNIKIFMPLSLFQKRKSKPQLSQISEECGHFLKFNFTEMCLNSVVQTRCKIGQSPELLRCSQNSIPE